MKITFSAGIFPPDIGGPANFVPRIATWLAGRGHVVDVVCWSDILDHDDAHHPFNVYRIPRSSNRINRFIATVRKLRAVGAKADVFFANTLDQEVHAAAQSLGRPAVHKVVGDRAWESARTRGWFSGDLKAYQRLPKSFVLRALDRWRTYPLTRAAKVIVPSRYLSRIVKGWGVPEERIRTIFNATPIDGPLGCLRLPRFSGKTLATVCRLIPWKGVDSIIAALAQLPRTRLAIAGEGPERERLERIARSKDVADRVLFLGPLGAADVRALLAVTDIFILNSSYEGLPHVVLEAMAAGVPVVATDVGGTSEVVIHDHNGLLVPQGDDVALIAALRRLLASETLARSLTTTARHRIERDFSEESCFEACERTLQEAAGGKRPEKTR